jgi:hypothetical protein
MSDAVAEPVEPRAVRKASTMSIVALLRRHRTRENQQSREAHPPARTIAVNAARFGSRLSRLRVRQPAVATELPYDVELAAELIRNTGQFPEYKRGLILVLAEYRQALYDLVTLHNTGTEES